MAINAHGQSIVRNRRRVACQCPEEFKRRCALGRRQEEEEEERRKEQTEREREREWPVVVKDVV